MTRPKQVDSVVPRGKAAFHALLPAAGYLFASPAGVVLLAFTAAAMTLSVVGGPKLSLFGHAFRAIRKPLRIRPGKQEEAAPHLFAEALGAVFLVIATTSLLLGAATVGWALALIVSALAALNWLAGICVGCQMYLLFARLRGRAGATA